MGPKTKIKMGGKKFDFCSSNFFPPVLIFVFGHATCPWVSEDAIFSTPANISQLVICPAHRAALGIGWRRSANERCRIPVILLHHSDDVLKKRREGSPKPTPSFLLKESGQFPSCGVRKKEIALEHKTLLDKAAHGYSDRLQG